MATADEVLSAMSDSDESSSAVCEIDPDTRVVSIPELYQTVGVESDEKVERIPFHCPRIVGDNIDLTKLKLYVNYRNANGDLGLYLIDDVKVDGDYINFSWQLYRKVTAYMGKIAFVICAKIADSSGNLTTEWNTTINNQCSVLQGLEATTEVESESADVIQQIQMIIQNIDTNTTRIDNDLKTTATLVSESKTSANNAASSASAAAASQKAAATSETNAKASETAAKGYRDQAAGYAGAASYSFMVDSDGYISLHYKEDTKA